MPGLGMLSSHTLTPQLPLEEGYFSSTDEDTEAQSTAATLPEPERKY